MKINEILLFLAVILEFVFVPLFLKASWPKKTKKSLILKMICASLFVCAGFLAVTISDNTSDFAKLVITGLIFGWLGDFFLHVSDKPICFLIGLLSFLGGHIFYICAYSRAIEQYFNGTGFFNPVEICAFILVFGAAVIYAVTRKMRLGAALIPVSVYTATLVAMLIKASSLGLRILFSYGQIMYPVLVCVMLIFGALQFVISDALLAIMQFSGRKKNRPMKIINIVTYFAAQILLACTLLFIN